MPVCRKIYIDCEDFNRIPYYEEVHRGYSKNGCYVVLSIPSKCTVWPGTTEIEYTEYVIVEERELKKNMLLIVKPRYGKPKKYVYPKNIYAEVKKLYIQPLLHGEKPYSTGVVFAGPPGTGKTSMAKIIAQQLGIPLHIIHADKILSRYLGESEKNIRTLINNAKKDPPAIILFDDADWLLWSRELEGGSGEEERRVMMRIQSILFDEMQEIRDEGLNILFIATTNVKTTVLDIAFKRFSRFGNTVFFPLPDYEAIYHILLDHFDKKKAEELARKFVNMGLNMDDVVGQIERIKKGLEIKAPEGSGRGYKRIYVDNIHGYEKLLKIIPREAFNKPSRIYIPGHEDVMTAIATQILYASGKNVIRIIDVRYIPEAVFMANTTNSGIIVSSKLDPRLLDYIHKNAEVPVIYVGELPPKTVPYITFADLDTLYSYLNDKKPIIEAIAKMYNVEIPENLWEKIDYTISSTEKLEQLLEAMVNLRVVNEKILEKLSYLVPRKK